MCAGFQGLNQRKLFCEACCKSGVANNVSGTINVDVLCSKLFRYLISKDLVEPFICRCETNNICLPSTTELFIYITDYSFFRLANNIKVWC